MNAGGVGTICEPYSQYKHITVEREIIVKATRVYYNNTMAYI